MTKKINFVYLIILSGFLIRLLFINLRPPTYDEAVTLAQITTTWKNLFLSTISGFNPPLFFILIKLWSLLSSKLFFLRLFPCFLGLITIISGFLIAKKIFSPKTALIFTLLLTFSPALIYEADNLRPYALAVLLMIWLLYFFLRYLQNKKIKFLFGFSLFLVFALYTHYYFIIVGLIFNLVFFTLPKRSLSDYLAWLISQSLSLLAFLPFAYLAFSAPRPQFFPAALSLLKLPGSIITMFISWDSLLILKLYPFKVLSFWSWLIIFLTVVLWFLSLIGFTKMKDKYFSLLFLFLSFLPSLIIFIISLVFKPVFGLRSFVIFSPAYYLLISFGLTALKPFYQTKFILSILTLIFVFLVYEALALPSSWQEINCYQQVKEQSLPTDLFAHADPSTLLLNRFVNPQAKNLALVSSWYPTPVEQTLGYELTTISALKNKGLRLWYFLLENQYYQGDLAWQTQRQLELSLPVIWRQKYPDLNLQITLFKLSP